MEHVENPCTNALPKTPKMLSLYLNTLEREEVKRTRTSSDAYRVRRTI